MSQIQLIYEDTVGTATQPAGTAGSSTQYGFQQAGVKTGDLVLVFQSQSASLGAGYTTYASWSSVVLGGFIFESANPTYPQISDYNAVVVYRNCGQPQSVAEAAATSTYTAPTRLAPENVVMAAVLPTGGQAIPQWSPGSDVANGSGNNGTPNFAFGHINNLQTSTPVTCTGGSTSKNLNGQTTTRPVYVAVLSFPIAQSLGMLV